MHKDIPQSDFFLSDWVFDIYPVKSKTRLNVKNVF